ncbi:E3 ubiquitin-protein ligase CBL-C isoform X3 [Alexandromys fortis]|uniref:E3 ubiquitin-protein ligase CBL-C isoform X3 n=1 Tax=Alexandromys fortis TaxID=100897 RepID=UPI0021527A13|nr:E3 ubiquitin-protein ligase CBL-C isoform X3 [Microtus fortis]
MASPRGWQWGEPRAFGRAVKLLQRLEEQCKDPRLVMGPPSLRVLLPRTAQLLREVAKARREAEGDPEGPGGAGDYLVIYLANLEAKGRKVAELLPPRGKKDANEEVFREGSRFRRQLAKLALIFSHMHAEMSALFPGGRYCGHLYQLTEGSAHTFWREHCGIRCVLPWAEFQSLLCACHPVEPGPITQALRSTLDLTCSGHVSVFEFDIFTRLFQPWPTLLKNWLLLAVNHPGYMAFLTYDEVQTRLQACRDKPGSLLYPDGKNHNPDLTELYQAKLHQRIEVSEEQLQLYEAMNSTFELCKICAERDKDVRIEPCGHLLCSHCLATWQQSDSQTCPFCRCQIKGHEAVSICQAQERSVEFRATTEEARDNCHHEAVWNLDQVTPAAPPLPPEDPSPRTPQDNGWLTVAPLTLPRLRAPLHLPKMASVMWEVPTRPQAREGATGAPGLEEGRPGAGRGDDAEIN